MLFSVIGGEDKPPKYLHMFRDADMVPMTKSDLLPCLDFELEAYQSVRTINPRAEIMKVSAKSGEGLEAWYGWIASRREDTQA